ncbi:MAG: hypothetical protein IT466_04480 [Moraxellaceae bacterium]|nr:hypothetical protein [Moraxellaceae bacterium]
MATPQISVCRLLARGDKVALIQGRLTITPASGKQPPSDWLAANRSKLITEAASMAGLLALEYIGYSVGNYSQKQAGGVTLQFCCMATGRSYYAIFNADTKRNRTTKTGKAGEPLPKDMFRVEKQSAFLGFWKSTGLPYHRLSDIHDYMGNLRGLVYTAAIPNDERLDAKSIRPLDISTDLLLGQMTPLHPDKPPTTSRQAPDNIPTRFPDKESPQSQTPQGLKPDSGAGGYRYGNTGIREHGDTAIHTPPESQTDDEWLENYDSAAPLKATDLGRLSQTRSNAQRLSST